MYFLIDYENVKNIVFRGTEMLEPDDCLIVFFSDPNTNVERRYLEDIERSGCSFETCKLVKSYRNALGFYIAAKTGELFGSGYRGPIAIISKDEGFKAVRDYWTRCAYPRHSVVLNENIEKAIITAGGSSPRVKRINANLTTLNLAKFSDTLTEKRQMTDMLQQQFDGTPLSDHIDDLGSIIRSSTSPKALYLASLRAFGHDNGLFAYRVLKDQLVLNSDKKWRLRDTENTLADENVPVTDE